jgi:hypothetical protein
MWRYLRVNMPNILFYFGRCYYGTIWIGRCILRWISSTIRIYSKALNIKVLYTSAPAHREFW